MLTRTWAEARFYCHLFVFRLKEPFTDFRATGITYVLYCFFIWLLSNVWLKFNGEGSRFDYGQVFLYIGVTELLFMSFLNTRAIASGSEDFSLFLARPRSWLGREFAGNFGMAFGKRMLFFGSLVVFSFALGVSPRDPVGFVARSLLLLVLLAPAQAFLSTLFSSLRLTYPQTDYFVLPISKLFLALGGVFGPLSDYGEPWRSVFLLLPGSDLFFQPAYFAVHGEFYEMSFSFWLLRVTVISLVLFVAVYGSYRMGRRYFQAWGG